MQDLFYERGLLPAQRACSKQIKENFDPENDPALVLDPQDADVQYILMPLRV